MKITLKPWGQEELLHQGFGYAVKRITLNQGHRTSLHYHNVKHEHIFVLSGVLNVEITGPGLPRNLNLEQGEFVAIEPLDVHQMSASTSDCVYLESQSDFLDDVVRLEDDYRR
jgi:quercetin dioxygenase-like cupin family protein